MLAFYCREFYPFLQKILDMVNFFQLIAPVLKVEQQFGYSYYYGNVPL